MSLSAKVGIYSIIYMIGSLEFGFVLKYGDLPIEDLKRQYPDWDFNKDKRKISFFSNFASLFGSLGGFAIRILTRYIGAKKSIFIFSILNCILWFLYYLLTPEKLIVGIIIRSIQGLIIGGLACITPIQMTNISPDETVGMIGCMNQFGIVLGMIIFPFASAFTNYHNLAIIGAVVDIVHAFMIFLVPDEKIEKDKESVFHMFNARGLFIVVMIMIFQQLCGVNAINNSLTKIMAGTGIYINENLQGSIASMTQLVSVLIASFNMDGLGRKRMFLFSLFLIVLSQILYIICLKLNAVGWCVASSVFLYLLSFGHGLGPIPWFIVHDIFPRSLRLDAQALVTFANMLSSFGVTYLFPVMQENMDDYMIMIIYMCITFLGIPFAWKFLPKKSDIYEDNLTLI